VGRLLIERGETLRVRLLMFWRSDPTNSTCHSFGSTCRSSTPRKYKPALVAQVAIATTSLCFNVKPVGPHSTSMMRSRMRPFAINSRGDLPPTAGRGDESCSSSFGATTYGPPRPKAVLALVSAAEISESARPFAAPRPSRLW
jgi:hypothetical protein